MNKEEMQEILEELHLVRPEILQPKAKKLFGAIMSIADERDISQNNWNELKKWLEENWKQSQDIWFVKIINKMQELEGKSE